MRRAMIFAALFGLPALILTPAQAATGPLAGPVGAAIAAPSPTVAPQQNGQQQNGQQQQNNNQKNNQQQNNGQQGQQQGQQGADQQGADQQGADQQGAGQQGADQQNNGQQGQQGADQQGADQQGGGQQGADQQGGGQQGGGQQAAGVEAIPADAFIDIQKVQPNRQKPRVQQNGSKGTFVSRCGTNANAHQNPDNFIVAPGVSNGAQHTHDYVGNLSTDGFSTDQSLQAAGTTCQQGDKSTYFWPVLRVRNGAGDVGQDGNVGTILQPASAQMQFQGNATSKVTEMPTFLRTITGNAKAATQAGANGNAQWTCTGFENRVTQKYPLCPPGSKVTRILEFPSCWDGQNIDSANHRTHIVFPDKNSGACPAGTKAVPALTMNLTYNVPQGKATDIALDSFPDEKHDPSTDHADFEQVMPAGLASRVAQCINSGQTC